MNVLKTIAVMAAVGAGSMAIATSAGAATYTFVGSWEVDQGPNWAGSPPNGPLAYSGDEAAALLFGGNASKYVTSTVDANPADINFEAWYSQIGYNGNQGNGGSLLPDNYTANKYLGLYYGPTSGYGSSSSSAASAYVNDNAGGSTFTNWAFTSNAPEPATWAMILIGVGMIGAGVRMARRKNALELTSA